MVAIIDKETRQSSQIQNYYTGSCVFITGATGFLGKLLLEKLLRTCPDIKKVFILIREKKGKAIEKRLEEILDNVFFDRIKKEQPNFTEKIFLIPGDCALPELGLNEDAKQKLINEVDCIFHCAATVRFDEKIRNAVHINIRATRDLLNLSKKIRNLKSFIYVSTAFSYCTRKEIAEEFYDPTITGEQLITVVNNMNEDLLSKITPTLLGDWPNTYALTKAVAEEVVQSHSQNLPVAIVRPSIVIATVSEPLDGWIDNLYGATGVTVGAALGLIRTLHCKENSRADLVPADFVINCTIAAAWEVGTTSPYSKLKKIVSNGSSDSLHDNIKALPDVNHSGNENLTNGVHDYVTDPDETEQKDKPPSIYNYVCSTQKPITWRQFMEYAERHLKHLPSPLMVWHYCLILNSNYFVHIVCVFLLHTVPAYLVDFILKCIGKEPMLVKGYQKINKFMDVLSYFSTQEWQFQDHNTQALMRKLNPEDTKLFNFDLTSFTWDSYFHAFALGGRIYLLKDPLDTLPQGRVKGIKLKIAHYTVVALLLFLLYKLLSILYNTIF